VSGSAGIRNLKPIMGIVGSALSSVISYSFCGIILLTSFMKKYNVSMRDIIIVNEKEISKIKSIILEEGPQMRMLKSILKTLFIPSYNSIYLCRLLIAIDKKNYRFLRIFVSNSLIHKYSMHIGNNCRIGKNIKFPHPDGIVIGDCVIIGDDCTIYHQVTLGKRNGNLNDLKDYPIVGNNVTIFAGAKIIGNVNVGDNSIIGANSVVLTDIEANCIYAGIPAKKIKNIL
jgi:serine O-acetyltransferase